MAADIAKVATTAAQNRWPAARNDSRGWLGRLSPTLSGEYWAPVSRPLPEFFLHPSIRNAFAICMAPVAA
jgi:hypothetical protein